MALLCRALVGALAAVVVARSSMTITWNTHPSAAATPAPQVHATVLAVRGDLIDLRLDDGTVRRFFATPDQVKAIRALVGARIVFTVTK